MSATNYPIGLQIKDDIEAVLSQFAERRDAFVVSARSLDVQTRNDAGSAGDVIRMAGQVRDKIDSRRLEITNPLIEARDSAIAAVDAFWADVQTEVAQLQARLDAFVSAESDRIKAQQAEQEAELARRRAMLAKETPTPSVPEAVPSAPVQEIRGDYGARVTPRNRVTSITIIDVKLIPEAVMASDKVTSAIKAVARDLAKHMKEIPGLKIDRGLSGQVY